LTFNIGGKLYGLSRYRVYDPELGTFLSRDFLRYMNKYRCWTNNPVGQVDKDGLAAETLKQMAQRYDRLLLQKQEAERRLGEFPVGSMERRAVEGVVAQTAQEMAALERKMNAPSPCAARLQIPRKVSQRITEKLNSLDPKCLCVPGFTREQVSAQLRQAVEDALLRTRFERSTQCGEAAYRIYTALGGKSGVRQSYPAVDITGWWTMTPLMHKFIVLSPRGSDPQDCGIVVDVAPNSLWVDTKRGGAFPYFGGEPYDPAKYENEPWLPDWLEGIGLFVIEALLYKDPTSPQPADL
jgi:hypothetical protein